MSIEVMKRIKSFLQDTKMIDSHTISAVVAECDMAILAKQPATPDPVMPDSSEHLRVIASLGDALRRLSFAAQTTGGTDGPDAELQSAIGQAEQALSLGGIWQAMSATTEPVYWEWRHLSTHPDTVDFGKWSEWKRVEARSAIHTIDDALAEFRAYIAQGYKYELRALYTHPAPSVPADVVRDAISTVREHYRGTDWGKAAESICDAIDAMLAAKDASA